MVERETSGESLSEFVPLSVGHALFLCLQWTSGALLLFLGLRLIGMGGPAVVTAHRALPVGVAILIACAVSVYQRRVGVLQRMKPGWPIVFPLLCAATIGIGTASLLLDGVEDLLLYTGMVGILAAVSFVAFAVIKKPPIVVAIQHG